MLKSSCCYIGRYNRATTHPHQYVNEKRHDRGREKGGDVPAQHPKVGRPPLPPQQSTTDSQIDTNNTDTLTLKLAQTYVSPHDHHRRRISGPIIITRASTTRECIILVVDIRFNRPSSAFGRHRSIAIGR